MTTITSARYPVITPGGNVVEVPEENMPGYGFGTGSVTGIGVTTANGISGVSSADPVTPLLTLKLVPAAVGDVPLVNGDLLICVVDNSTLRIKYKGSDAVVRSLDIGPLE